MVLMNGEGVDVIPFCCMLMTEMHLVKRRKWGPVSLEEGQQTWIF